MLSMLWWLPLAVVAAAVVPIWRGTRRLVREAAALQASVEALAQLRPLVAEVEAEISGVSGALRHVTSSRGIHDLGRR